MYDSSRWCKERNFLVLKMSTFVPNKMYLRGILLHYFIQNKSATKARRILVETYGDNALSDTTWGKCLSRLKLKQFFSLPPPSLNEQQIIEFHYKTFNLVLLHIQIPSSLGHLKLISSRLSKIINWKVPEQGRNRFITFVRTFVHRMV